MQLIEHLCRAMCESLNLNPDEMVLVQNQNNIETIPGTISNRMIHSYHERWKTVLPAVISVIKGLYDNPTDDMIAYGNVGLSKVKHLSDPQAQVAWRYMLDKLLNTPSDDKNIINPPTSITPVLQDWVGTIPRRQQGVLILALRGPDGIYKEHPCKEIIRHMRGCVMNSGREGKPMAIGQHYETDSFMSMKCLESGVDWQLFCVIQFFTRFDEYNTHFLTHFIQAAEILGFKHPIPLVRNRWMSFYQQSCNKLHVNPETLEQFEHRLRDGPLDDNPVVESAFA